ncbi:CRISPR-associated ring nuclease Csm6 [Thioalkalivibrio paradoxus]|uniref:CRISPR-associated protein n=1 Tax=Thioalkalivibrio paradoxus ARh 1 TaxID=713585 RepID=W0DIH4_9GAMM|nr:CRISPR-associated ring nuclease Csm6 [Thioalkalivibrio paradoxus]AHE98429.1 CRISPR-associated protein [Thioalkalivibrio paradoxus ARh 1]
MEPEEFSRRVLLAVTGLSPQVVTETLYGLARQRRDRVPTEVHVITTEEGAERVRLALLSREPGWFRRLCEDLELTGLRFGNDSIHVLRDVSGTPLADIRTPEDNERAADFITEKVREFTADPESALHVSIAGGRKTMGYYAGYALSLFGRPQDRLSHVLVSEPFESSWDFFYPTPYSRVITTRNDKLADTADASVTLAEIPFVSLRDGLPTRLVEGGAQLSETVAAARRALEPPELVIDLAGRCLEASGERLPMAPAELAFYALFARKRQVSGHALRRSDPELSGPFLAEYQRIVGPMSGDLERAEEALQNGMDADYFDQRKARTNATLRQHLGPQLARLYAIHADGKRDGRFSLRLEPEAIRFDAVQDPGK